MSLKLLRLNCLGNLLDLFLSKQQLMNEQLPPGFREKSISANFLSNSGPFLLIFLVSLLVYLMLYVTQSIMLRRKENSSAGLFIKAKITRVFAYGYILDLLQYCALPLTICTCLQL